MNKKSDSKSKKTPLHRPITRRDFLAQGLIGSTGFLMAPSILEMLIPATAHADSVRSRAGFLPFLVIDCAGGPAFPGNFLVGKQGGPEDLLKSYDKMGWDPRRTALDRQFGLPMAGGNIGQILVGINQTASAEARAGLRMSSICNISAIDTPNNLHSALPLVAYAGLKGAMLEAGLGMAPSQSGANTGAPTEITYPNKPLEIRKYEDLEESLSGGAFFKKLDLVSKREFFGSMLAMIQTQIGRETSLSSELLAGAQVNLDQAGMVSSNDPRKMPELQAAYQINPNSASDDPRVREATIVSSVLQGVTGPGAILINGCDYHDQTQITGDTKDLQIGQSIGRMIESAFRLKKKFMFQLLSDGGIAALPGTRIWTSDAADKSLIVLGAYDPVKAPTQRRLQVGHYTDGQGIESETLLGNSTPAAAFAVLANYLNFCGKTDLFNLIPRKYLAPNQIDDVLLFS